MQETNDLNDIVTSRDPVVNWDVPTLGISGRALRPFPTLGVELGESDELVEEPADKTRMRVQTHTHIHTKPKHSICTCISCCV